MATIGGSVCLRSLGDLPLSNIFSPDHSSEFRRALSSISISLLRESYPTIPIQKSSENPHLNPTIPLRNTEIH
jgi:hypothetical protein